MWFHSEKGFRAGDACRFSRLPCASASAPSGWLPVSFALCRPVRPPSPATSAHIPHAAEASAAASPPICPCAIPSTLPSPPPTPPNPPAATPSTTPSPLATCFPSLTLANLPSSYSICHEKQVSAYGGGGQTKHTGATHGACSVSRTACMTPTLARTLPLAHCPSLLAAYSWGRRPASLRAGRPRSQLGGWVPGSESAPSSARMTSGHSSTI